MKKRRSKAWIVLIGVAIARALLQGITYNCLAVLYPGMSANMGVPSSALMVYTSFTSITVTLSLPFTGKLLAKVKKPKLLFIIAAIDMAVSYMLLSMVNSLPALYILGILSGLGSGLVTIMMVPYFVNSWFADKAPLAMSIATSFNAVAGLALTPIAGSIIENHGWRTCALTLGLLGLVASVASLALLAKVLKDPSERYVVAKVAAETEAKSVEAAPLTGVSEKVALKSPTFYFAWLFTAML